jgi:hypothetical protein
MKAIRNARDRRMFREAERLQAASGVNSRPMSPELFDAVFT